MGFFGNLMNNYMYGKAGQADYTVASMPKTRLELFGATLKVRWASLFGLNLLYMIAWIPTLIWTVLNVSILFSESFNVNDAPGYFSAYLLVLAPCILITGPFTAGITFVCRNWSRDEHSFVLSDFWDAVKNNWKQALPVSLISGLCPLAAYYSFTFYGQMGAQKSAIFYIPMVLVIFVAALWKLSESLIYTMMVTYDLRLRDLVRNGLLLTFARLPFAIGIKLLTWVVPAIALGLGMIMPQWQMIALLVVLAVYVLWIPAFNRMIQCAYANACCEKYLNSRIEGARTNIGLRPEDWDDTEYRPEDDEEE